MGPSPDDRGRLSRRGFLLGTATGLAAGISATALGAYLVSGRRHAPPGRGEGEGGPLYGGRPREVDRPPYAMPGRYPGRVVEVRHPEAVAPDHTINARVVERMIDRGMAELTGADPGDLRGTWGRFFHQGDVVGIKVNPVGRKPKPGEPGRVTHAAGSISSFAVLLKVIRCLQAVGIPARDIVVFERYANEFCDAGYADLLRSEAPEVRWLASAAGYSNEQLDIAGFDTPRDRWSPELARHVAGYDPDVFTGMGFCMPEHAKQDPRFRSFYYFDDRRFRSHLSLIVTRLVNKVINLPVLKDHRSAGVTLALKNLSHGMNNNVARSHLPMTLHGFGASAAEFGPNQCNTFIPQAASQQPLREKATLHILDGLIGVYEGGPGSWNQTWATWPYRGLLFATDPVALDHVGWDIINAKRLREGWPPVERMGFLYQTPEVAAGTDLAPLAGPHPLGGMTLAAAARNREAGRASEVFNVRQPDHIILAGKLGLGRFQRDDICLRQVRMKS